MRTSIISTRVFPYVFCVLIPLYVAIRASASLPDVGHLWSFLSKNAEVVQNGLSKTTVEEVFEPSAELSKLPHTPAGRERRESLTILDGLEYHINCFERYAILAEQEIQRKHAWYDNQTPTHKRISQKLDYPAHLEKARKGMKLNTRFSEQLAHVGKSYYHINSQRIKEGECVHIWDTDHVFAQVARDWSVNGNEVRQVTFSPILNELEKHWGGENVDKIRILVPGSGLGRLASDIADQGYNVTANELNYGPILAYHMLKNHTSSLHQHILQPFATKWSTHPKEFSRYSTLTIPDHWPNKAVKLIEGDFFTAFPREGEFDAVVTLFFIDVTRNVVDMLSNIHRLLKPGGMWINLGPLNWGNQAALPLSIDEVFQLADLLGLDIDYSSVKSIGSCYAEHSHNFLRLPYGKYLPCTN